MNGNEACTKIVMYLHIRACQCSSLIGPLLAQVGEVEEQLAAARREVTKSEEANQKLQRDVKEVGFGSTA